MFDKDYFSDIIEKAVAEIDYGPGPRGLFQPVEYTLEGGGKRLRPLLLLATCDALGGDALKAVNQAVGIEMFHNFTLLHDDVMDKAEVRRGRPTVHRRWNESVAILSGDAMLTLATMLVVKDTGRDGADCMAQILDLFNTTAMEVYGGQQLDMEYETRRAVTVEEYIEMIRLKTSVLLACACKMGAMMARATAEDAAAMYRYGELLGLAFQLQDDNLDTYGDPALFGKEIGGDIINEKKTWLWINALNREPKRLQRVLDQKLTDYLKIREIRKIYDDLNLRDEAQALIERYAAEAVEAIAGVKMSPEAREFFTSLALKSAARNH
ncbi:MAG: polyprenyl synthetase family protein, partial [Muribaculaceae bacterium]|nr:polyprenyl synthetase family protein [Muribaculaceae bacterium]